MRFIFHAIFLLFTLLVVPMAQGQFNGANVWHFGYNCVLDFNSGSPIGVGGVSFSSCTASEGTSSYCDEDGNLLFYSNGINVFDINGNSFPSFQEWAPASIGIPLLGGGLSATNSAFIVPDPANTNEYYLFFAAEEVGYNGLSQQLGLSGLSYVKVDMTLNGGLGDLTTDLITLNSDMTEKIAVTNVCGENAYWLVCHRYNSNEFYSYKISENGIEAPVISATGYVHDCPIGQMKISPDGSKIGAVTYGFFSLTNTLTLEVLEFDNATGQVGESIIFDTNFEQIPGVNQTGLYSIAFSMDGSKVYAGLVNDIQYGTPSEIYQYDLDQIIEDVVSNRVTVAQLDGYVGQMQLGPDCKLYICNGTTNSMAVINNPDLPWPQCDYVEEGVVFDMEEFTFVSLGLPAFNDANLYQNCLNLENSILVQDTCVNSLTQFQLENINNIDDISWNFGDPQSGASNSSNDLTPQHVYSEPGQYEVTANFFQNCLPFEIPLTITVIPGQTASTFFDYSDSICNESVQVILPLLDPAFASGGSFSSDPELDLNSTDGAISINDQIEGEFVITYLPLAIECISANEFSDTLLVLNCIPDEDDFPSQTEPCFLYVPNTFTPDGDGLNDVWKALGNCPPLNYSIQLFNRWGNLFFESSDFEKAWTGGVEEAYAPNDVYQFRIKYTFDGTTWQEENGHVLVLR